MTQTRTHRIATVGVADHVNSAVLVTLAFDGELLDRRLVGFFFFQSAAATGAAR